MSILREAIMLCAALARKKYLNDDERATYSALNSYINLQVRTASLILKDNLLEQGYSEGDIEGYVPS